MSNGDNPKRFCRFCGVEMPTVDMHAPGIWRREADCELEMLRSRLEALQKEFSVLYVDHENCMDGRTREADARVEAENRFGRAVKALEAIRDGIPGPVLHALDTLNGLKRMESDSMYERAVENRRDLFSELKEGLESIPVEISVPKAEPGDLLVSLSETKPPGDGWERIGRGWQKRVE